MVTHIKVLKHFLVVFVRHLDLALYFDSTKSVLPIATELMFKPANL